MYFLFSGGPNIAGRLIDYVSPTFFVSASGFVSIQGSAQTNFTHIGFYSSEFSINTKVYDFTSEISDLSYESNLTISDYTISPSCGCGPISPLLSLKHNLMNSAFISSFFRRSGLDFSDSVKLRHRSKDSSWRSAQHFSGRGKNGSPEDLSILYGISCSLGFWEFFFSATVSNTAKGDELKTKFILDIPADIICSDGNIDAVIEADLSASEFRVLNGEAIFVVSPERPLAPNPKLGSADFFVEGIYNQKRIYYDEIGIFKNRYWNDNFFRITINIPSSQEMKNLEMYRIFS
jgi:hypothetical protein